MSGKRLRLHGDIQKICEEISELEPNDFFDERQKGQYAFEEKSFERIMPAIKTALEISAQIKTAPQALILANPLENLDTLDARLQSLLKTLRKLRSFKEDKPQQPTSASNQKIEKENISNTRDDLCNEFDSSYEGFLSSCVSALAPYNLRQLSNIETRLNNIKTEDALSRFDIVFENYAKDHFFSSLGWFTCGALLALAAALFAKLEVYPSIKSFIATETPWPVSVSFLFVNSIVILIMLGMATWCLRNYSINKRNHLVNRHRAVTLKTFQTFADVTAKSDTLHTTIMGRIAETLFDTHNTGYENSTDANLNITQVADLIGKLNNNKSN